MQNVIFNENSLANVLNKPSRFDMAISFYCVLKKAGEYYLATYFYNPKWNLFYPFYDDVNKTPVLKQSIANTYKDLVNEINKVMDVNETEKLNLALSRYKELIGTNCNVIKSPVNFNMYELKYSKTTNVYTIYKFFNFIITTVDDLQKVITPNNLECKLFKLNNLDANQVVGNAISFVNSAKKELIKYAIEI